MSAPTLPQMPRLILCAPPRTGSETLCELLADNGLGDPKEYLNNALFDFADGKNTVSIGRLADYLSRTMQASHQDHGLFAVKIQAWQLQMFLTNDVGRALFDGAKLVYLVRPDLTRQIESQAAAKLTGQWYRDRTEDMSFSSQDVAKAYRRARRFILGEYFAFSQFFAITGLEPEIITSTQLFAQPEAVIRRIGAIMDRPLSQVVLRPDGPQTAPYGGQKALRAQLAALSARDSFGGYFAAPAAAPPATG